MTNPVTITLTPEQVTSVLAQAGTPPQPARELYYAYFGANDEQIEQTSDHVNLLMEAQWSDWEWAVERIRAMGRATMLAVDKQCYSPTPPRRYLGSNVAMTNMHRLCQSLRAEGLLGLIRAFYPLDEPEIQGTPAGDVVWCNGDLRALIAQYPELAQTKLAVVYSAGEDYRGLESYDWVGLDDYGNPANALGAKYERLRARLSASQRTILVPGGADPWRNDPGPFYAKAKADEKVILVMPFIWIDQWGGTTNLGIHGNGMSLAYRDIGLRIKNVA